MTKPVPDSPFNHKKIEAFVNSLVTLLTQPKTVSPLQDQPDVSSRWTPKMPSATPTPQRSAVPQTTSTPIPAQAPRPQAGVTPYPTPSLSQSQKDWGGKLFQVGQKGGLANPQLMQSTGFNESSLSPSTTPNINQYERSYGPAQINLLAHPEITAQQAQDPTFAANFMMNRLKYAQEQFPDSIEKQILYYNVPQNAYIEPKDLSQQAAWYLYNQLRFLGRTPSPEYLPVLQKYGFFK